MTGVEVRVKCLEWATELAKTSPMDSQGVVKVADFYYRFIMQFDLYQSK